MFCDKIAELKEAILVFSQLHYILILYLLLTLLLLYNKIYQNFL